MDIPILTAWVGNPSGRRRELAKIAIVKHGTAKDKPSVSWSRQVLNYKSAVDVSELDKKVLRMRKSVAKPRKLGKFERRVC